jgi:hypothetical protein
MGFPRFWTGWQGAATIGLLAMGLTVTGGMMPAQAQFSPPAPEFATNAVYRVIVNSDSPQVLQQVIQVEPTAFLRNFTDGKVRIQAGALDSLARAQEQVDALARLGIPATAYDRDWRAVYSTTPNPNPNPQPGGPPVPRPGDPQKPGGTGIPSGYYAVVPIDRDVIGLTYEKLRKLGIPESFITVGQQNRGWHVSVGVYPTRAAADAMSQYLRDKGGLDARTYYER